MLEHGGRIVEASIKYNRPTFDWLDLSTGINPIPYPVPQILPNVWRRLPQDNDGLLLAARSYYNTENLLEVAGSQAAIQAIPQLSTFSKRCLKIGLMLPSYNEHAHAWRQAGHEIVQMEINDIAAQCEYSKLDVLLVCNPNNPTGDFIEQSQIEESLVRMQKSGGTVIVDQAFMDSTPEKSALPLLKKFPNNLIVLRSLGKFFGLAGARVGFVAASEQLLSALREQLGPWTVSGPSRFAAYHALNDTQWQKNNRLFLKTNSQKLRDELTSAGFTISGFTDYFAWVKHPDAEFFHESLCKFGIFTRLFNEPQSLRFGLPANEQEFWWLNKGLRSHEPEVG